MSGTGYDLSTAIYSQDGRVFQVEYALKAVERAETAVGFRCRDGVILACEKIRQSPLESADANKRVHSVDAHIGLAFCGARPDGEYVLGHARKECEGYRKNFGVPITGAVLAERMANFVHAHTLYMSYRPLGCAVMLSSCDGDRCSLFLIENSGAVRGYFGCAAGKGRQPARAAIERLAEGMSVAEALPHVARAVAAAHEEFKEKTYELELGVVLLGQADRYQLLPYEQCEELRQRADRELEDAE